MIINQIPTFADRLRGCAYNWFTLNNASIRSLGPIDGKTTLQIYMWPSQYSLAYIQHFLI